MGYEPYNCQSEDEARSKSDELIAQKKWPCYFFESDTTGEKDFEEFYTLNEQLVLDRFSGIGVISASSLFDGKMLDTFVQSVMDMQARGIWTKAGLLNLFTAMIPEFSHKETGKYLDQRM